MLTVDELNVIRGRLRLQGYIDRPDALLLLEQAERMRVFAGTVGPVRVTVIDACDDAEPFGQRVHYDEVSGVRWVG